MNMKWYEIYVKSIHLHLPKDVGIVRISVPTFVPMVCLLNPTVQYYISSNKSNMLMRYLSKI